MIASPGRKIAAMTITNSGTAPLITEASDESTVCSANVIRLNGIAMLITPMTNRWPYVRGSRGSGSRAIATTVASRTNPMSSRNMISVNGCEAVIDADLDEQVAAAPEEAEGERR